jgi:hypothetical protein
MGANYKMSNGEYEAKIKSFKNLHKKCGDDCNHLDLFYKKMFV